MSTPSTLITTYLEMRSPENFRPAFVVEKPAQIVRMETPDLAYYRWLYAAVGEMWRWRDRLIMPDEGLRAVLKSPLIHVYVLYVAGAPAGYVELAEANKAVEIAYFGIRPALIGQGWGKHLLTFGVTKAWTLENTERVWLHTCNLDSPSALKNYLARGFVIYDETHEPMPERYLD